MFRLQRHHNTCCAVLLQARRCSTLVFPALTSSLAYEQARLGVLFMRVSWRSEWVSEAARRMWREKVSALTIFTTTNLLAAKILVQITH